MSKKGIDQESKDLLVNFLTKIENKDDAKGFLNDFFSASEVKDFGRRLMAAKMLAQQKTYNEIGFIMGMSPTTINKINIKTKYSRLMGKILREEANG